MFYVRLKYKTYDTANDPLKKKKKKKTLGDHTVRALSSMDTRVEESGQNSKRKSRKELEHFTE